VSPQAMATVINGAAVDVDVYCMLALQLDAVDIGCQLELDHTVIDSGADFVAYVLEAVTRVAW
jgi:hypothetical protein